MTRRKTTSWPVKIIFSYRGYKLSPHHIFGQTCSVKAARQLAKAYAETKPAVPCLMDWTYEVIYIKKSYPFRTYRGNLDFSNWMSIAFSKILKENYTGPIMDQLNTSSFLDRLESV